MFALFLVILLWPRADAEGGSAEPQWTYCHETLPEYCLQLSQNEIRAEAGLCAVIKCSFKTAPNFNPTSLVWFKCDDQRCRDSIIIFDSENNNTIQSSFSGRVSLLESDLSRRNCSIIINDLQLSDSGEYALRVNGVRDRFSFILHRATISVTALQQKPTVLSPALTEGQRASLSCIAPGLCSGSEPTFTWTWRGAGDVPNITTATTESLTPVSHRHSSTLELTASAELHGAQLSCTVSYKSSSTQDSVRINVTYLREPILFGDTTVEDGSVLNLTCSVDSFPPSSVTIRKRGAEVTKQTETHTYKTGSASLVIMKVTKENAGVYECTAQHELNNQTTHMDVKVISAPHILNSCRCVYDQVLLSVVIVSLILNIVIVIILFQWRMKSKKPNQEDRVYVSLRKTEASSEYEVIARPNK